MSEQYQPVYDAINNAFGHAGRLAEEAACAIGYAQSRPSVVFRPSIQIDGDHWCALYGENLQDGVAGFGKSPELAMMDFDKNWLAALPERKKI